jgi:hypothetical protein
MLLTASKLTVPLLKRFAFLSPVCFMLCSTLISVQGQMRTVTKDRHQQLVEFMMGNTPVLSKANPDSAEILEQIYPTVARKFFLLFPEAINPSWIKETGFLYVTFLNSGNKATASFNPRGSMNYCISYIREADFPADLLQKVKGSYPAEEIFSIKEIMTEDMTMHEIVLQNNQHYTVISLTSNGISEIRKIKRS